MTRLIARPAISPASSLRLRDKINGCVGLRILIVEDDKHIRKILEQLLTHEPSLAARAPEVVSAQDGKEGLAALDKGPYDLVISDLLMPRMDGFAFTRELRKHPQGGTVPLIVTSAIYKDQATIARLQSETGAQFFAKPFQIRDILNAVKKLLDGAPKIESSRLPRPDVTPTGARKLSGAQPTVGSLAERRPPRILLELWEKKTTGTLLLQRGKVKKEIALVHGTPVAATSNLRTETLGHFLVGRGVIDEQQHRDALKRAQESQERLGQSLVELGFITDADLMKQLGAQMRSKITNVLRWKDGDWMLTPGAPPATPLQTPVEAPRVVFSGLNKTAHVDEIATEQALVRGRIALTLRAERHREAFVRVFGDKGLSALQRRPLVEELLVGADPTPMLVQLDALFICGMAEIETAAVGQKDPAEKSDPIALRRLPVASVIVDDLPPPEQNLYDKLFGDDTGPVMLPDLDAAKSPFDDEDDETSGVMQMPSTAAQQAHAVAAKNKPLPDAAVEALRQEVLHEYLGIQGKDYYQVLRLAREAAPEDIAAAYGTIGKQFRLERFADVDLGPDYARLEEIHAMLRAAFETLSSRELRAGYDVELDRRQRPGKGALDADLLAQKAVEKLAAGDADGASDLLERAVAAAPDQADYHALLAWAVFQNEGANAAAGAAAWRHLQAAFEIDAENIGANEYAGRIATVAGDDERAIGHLTKVLDADPARAEALTALEAACLRKGEHKRLERTYRKLIHRLGDAGDPERALRLWWRLAELYRTRLDDKPSAKIAYEIAAKLAPEDPRPQEALARLYAEDPETWKQAAQALRDSWRLSPDDAGPGRALFKLHLEGERWDAAYAIAQALALRGVSEPAADELARRLRPRFLVRAAQPVDGTASLADRVRHADDDRDLSDLFARIFAVWQPPFGWDVLGVTPDDRIDPALLPAPFARVLGYCAQQLGVSAPPVYRRADFTDDTHVGAARPPLLLAGPQALALGDKSALAFRLGRALTYLLPGRAVAGALPSRQLKQTVLAAMTLAHPSLRVDDPDGEIKTIRVALTSTAPTLARDVAPMCERIVAGSQATLNLGRYARGLARTADRVGLLLCNDLSTAVRIVMAAGAPGAENELIDFALSDEYLEAREALGLSVCV
ncbi:MAG: response regulator receiver protein [bacterium]|nr:response regulator receiver protein [bacterium]